MTSAMLICFVLGLLGGLVRAAVGITKYLKQTEENRKIKKGYLVSSLITALLAGGVAGLLADDDWRIALVFGYAGTDLLENAYKIIWKNNILQKSFK